MKNFVRRFKKLTFIVVITGGIFAGIAFTSDKSEITKNLDIFISVLRELDNYYVDDIDASQLVRKGIDAMLETLDPYTVFIPESDISEYQFMTSGSYGGVGAVVSKSGDYVMISETYEGFPAQVGGLRAGDIIMQIDAKSTKGLTVSDVSVLLKGQAETKVDLLIKRPGTNEPFKVTLTRQNIHVKNVPYYGMVSDSVGYIMLSNFRDNASDEVKKAVLELKATGKLKGLILDLRSNPGGLLYEAVKIVNLFVDKGQLIVSTKGKNASANTDYKAPENPVDKELPLIVLINRNSASASEIVSGALQDLDRAVIVGQRSFGKGLVQITRKLSYNAQLKLTTSKYYIPSGRCIQALDYSHKDVNGKAIKVADSLIKSFRTKNGRVVRDGAGITPDIKVQSEKASDIAIALINQHVIFDFATEYRNSHPTVPDIYHFAITDKDYEDFIIFAGGKNISYLTSTEKALEKVKTEAEDENYYENLKSSYDTLFNRLQAIKKKELHTERKEIEELLNGEIAARYFYQKGRIVAGLKDDPDVLRSIGIFRNPSEYRNILMTSPGTKN